MGGQARERVNVDAEHFSMVGFSTPDVRRKRHTLPYGGDRTENCKCNSVKMKHFSGGMGLEAGSAVCMLDVGWMGRRMGMGAWRMEGMDEEAWF